MIVEAITPRRPHEIAIDLGATLELIDFLSQSGAHGIALLGSAGEFVHFSVDERRQMAALAAKRSRIPLLVNVSHSTLDGAVELACDAAASGTTGVLVMPPYFFRYSQDTIRTFYLDFAAQVRDEAPIYLYNVPLFTSEIEISTALNLLDTGLFAGIVDASGSWEYFTRLRDHATTRRYDLLIADDRLFASARASGAQGIVSGVACAVPELMLAIESAVASGDVDRARALDARVGEFTDWLSRFAAPIGIKEAVRLRNKKIGPLAVEPGTGEKELMAEFRSWFVPWLAAVRDECMVDAGRLRGR